MKVGSASILVVDDELAIRDLLEYGLSRAGMEIRAVADGRRALALLDEWRADAIVLDLMLPAIDGITLLPMLRRVTDAPIIMLSAHSSASEKVVGLEAGADDYIGKPFAMDELVARIHSALRRPRLEVRERLNYGELSMNVGQRTVHRAGRRIELSQREYALLETLMRCPERTLTRTELLRSVWGTDRFITTTIVDTYVSYLRAKIDAWSDRKLIRTVRGAGYMLGGEAE